MAAAEDQAEALSHSEVLRVLSGVLLVIMLAALDQMVVATALPAIAGELHGLRSLSWIVTAYLLTSTAFTPIYGKLGDLYGRPRLLNIAILIFLAASMLCAAAPSMGALIAARALQGLGGGGLISTAQAIVADVISPRERGRYQAYFASVWAIASIAGPVVGGLFVQYLSWRYIFWINLPIGLAALILARRGLRRLMVQSRPHTGRVDLLGAALMVPGVTALLLVTAWGGIVMPWTSAPILSLLMLAAALLTAFAVQELRVADPLLPPRLFANPVIRVAGLIAFLVAMAMVGAIVLLPVYLQLVRGVSPGGTGVQLVPLLGGNIVGAFISGQLMRQTGRYRIFIMASLPLAVAGFLLCATISAGTPVGLSTFYLLLIGAGLGGTFPMTLVSIQNAADVHDIGTATSLLTFSRSLGGSFGAALFWSILLSEYTSHLTAAGISDTGLARDLLRGGSLATSFAAGLPRELVVESLTQSFRVAFIGAAVLVGLAAVTAIFLKEIPLRAVAARQARNAAAEPSP